MDKLMELVQNILDSLKEFKAAKIIELIKDFISKLVVAPQ